MQWSHQANDDNSDEERLGDLISLSNQRLKESQQDKNNTPIFVGGEVPTRVDRTAGSTVYVKPGELREEKAKSQAQQHHIQAKSTEPNKNLRSTSPHVDRFQVTRGTNSGPTAFSLNLSPLSESHVSPLLSLPSPSTADRQQRSMPAYNDGSSSGVLEASGGFLVGRSGQASAYDSLFDLAQSLSYFQDNIASQRRPSLQIDTSYQQITGPSPTITQAPRESKKPRSNWWHDAAAPFSAAALHHARQMDPFPRLQHQQPGEIPAVPMPNYVGTKSNQLSTSSFPAVQARPVVDRDRRGDVEHSFPSRAWNQQDYMQDGVARDDRRSMRQQQQEADEVNDLISKGLVMYETTPTAHREAQQDLTQQHSHVLQQVWQQQGNERRSDNEFRNTTTISSNNKRKASDTAEPSQTRPLQSSFDHDFNRGEDGTSFIEPLAQLPESPQPSGYDISLLNQIYGISQQDLQATTTRTRTTDRAIAAQQDILQTTTPQWYQDAMNEFRKALHKVAVTTRGYSHQPAPSTTPEFSSTVVEASTSSSRNDNNIMDRPQNHHHTTTTTSQDAATVTVRGGHNNNNDRNNNMDAPSAGVSANDQSHHHHNNSMNKHSILISLLAKPQQQHREGDTSTTKTGQTMLQQSSSSSFGSDTPDIIRQILLQIAKQDERERQAQQQQDSINQHDPSDSAATTMQQDRNSVVIAAAASAAGHPSLADSIFGTITGDAATNAAWFQELVDVMQSQQHPKRNSAVDDVEKGNTDDNTNSDNNDNNNNNDDSWWIDSEAKKIRVAFRLFQNNLQLADQQEALTSLIAKLRTRQVLQQQCLEQILTSDMGSRMQKLRIAILWQVLEQAIAIKQQQEQQQQQEHPKDEDNNNRQP